MEGDKVKEINMNKFLNILLMGLIMRTGVRLHNFTKYKMKIEM